MNTIQITRALKQDPMTSKTFYGVFPSDKLPQTIEKYPCGIVANTDPSDKPGEHWIAMFISIEQKGSLKKGSFFDSLGKLPEFYGTSFTNFLNKHCNEWGFNSRKLQSDWSAVCGEYCLFYLYQRSRGHSLNKIVRVFNNNTLINDAMVSQFVKNHFKVIDNRLHVNHNQISKKRIL